MGKIRVLLVDDQKLFIENLKTVLELTTDDIAVVGIAFDGREAVRMTDALRPEIVLMDVRMPVMDGVEAARIIHEAHPETRIIMLTTFDNDGYVHDALQYGARGYILKNVPPQELFSSIRAVHEGGVHVSQEVADRMVGSGRSAGRPGGGRGETGGGERRVPADLEGFRSAFDSLTPREKEIVGHIAMAYSNRQIAEKTAISEQTVKNYISRIYGKLGVDNRSHLMRLYYDMKEGRP